MKNESTTLLPSKMPFRKPTRSPLGGMLQHQNQQHHRWKDRSPKRTKDHWPPAKLVDVPSSFASKITWSWTWNIMEYEDYPLKKEGTLFEKKHHAEVVCATSEGYCLTPNELVIFQCLPTSCLVVLCNFEAQISNLESSKVLKLLNTLGGFINIAIHIWYFVIDIFRYLYHILYIFKYNNWYIFIYVYIDLRWPKSLHTTSRCIPSWWGTCRAANGMQPDPWWLLCCHLCPMLT